MAYETLTENLKRLVVPYFDSVDLRYMAVPSPDTELDDHIFFMVSMGYVNTLLADNRYFNTSDLFLRAVIKDYVAPLNVISIRFVVEVDSQPLKEDDRFDEALRLLKNYGFPAEIDHSYFEGDEQQRLMFGFDWDVSHCRGPEDFGAVFKQGIGLMYFLYMPVFTRLATSDASARDIVAKELELARQAPEIDYFLREKLSFDD